MLRHDVLVGRLLRLGSGTCIPSGANGSAGQVCNNGAFVACGGSGQTCCASSTCTAAGACCANNLCIVSGTTCGGALASTCVNGSCGTCGAAGQDCCRDANGQRTLCTASGLACGQNQKCVACGGAGEECCAGNACGAGGCCDNNTNLCIASGGACSSNTGTCSGGGCQGGTCGKLGQPACSGDVACTAPFTIRGNGVCVSVWRLG